MYSSSEIHSMQQRMAVREAVRQVEERMATGRAGAGPLMPQISARSNRPPGYYDEAGDWQDYETASDVVEAYNLAP